MEIKSTYSDTVVFIDFDGTVALLDTNVELVSKYGNDETMLYEEKFIKGELPNRIVIQKHYQTMRLTPETYYETVHSLPLDPGFLSFYRTAKHYGIPISILSGSIREGIGSYLARHSVTGIDVFGNNMSVTDGVIVFEPVDEIFQTYCGNGLCANCKSKHLVKARNEGKTTIYIGDGLTDLCAARYADTLYAKATLADYCQENNIPFIRFYNFYDVYRHFFGMEPGYEES